MDGLKAVQMLNVKQAAEALGFQESTIRAWILKRRIAYVKIGQKSVRIPRSEIERLIDKNFVPARQEAA